MSIGGTPSVARYTWLRDTGCYRNQRLAQRILDNELGCANASEAV